MAAAPCRGGPPSAAAAESSDHLRFGKNLILETLLSPGNTDSCRQITGSDQKREEQGKLGILLEI